MTTVVPIHVSTFTYPANHPEAPGTSELFAFLIRSSAGDYLVDTGIGAGHAWIDEHYQPRNVDLLAAIRRQGVDPTRLSAIICSHLHFDHHGNNRLFPGVPVYAQRAEYAIASGEDFTVPEWLDFVGADYRLLDGDLRLDDAVEIIATPGHTPGHQSVAARTDDGLVMIVAQAAYDLPEFAAYAHGRVPAKPREAWSREAYDRSLAMLHARKPVRAYFSHDRRTWTPSVRESDTLSP